MFHDYVTRYRTEEDIEKLAEQVRKLLCPGGEQASDILAALYAFKTDANPIGRLQVIPRPDEELGEAEAYATSDPARIHLRKSLFEAAKKFDPHARGVLAHELGHVVMHRGSDLRARIAGGNKQPFAIHPNESAERQAWVFSDAFLMPIDEVRRAVSPEHLSEICNVTLEAAERRHLSFQTSKSRRSEPSQAPKALTEIDIAWRSARVHADLNPNVFRLSRGGMQIERSRYGDLRHSTGWVIKHGEIYSQLELLTD